MDTRTEALSSLCKVFPFLHSSFTLEAIASRLEAIAIIDSFCYYVGGHRYFALIERQRKLRSFAQLPRPNRASWCEAARPRWLLVQGLV